MISVPDIGQVYPKTGLNLDLSVGEPRYLSAGSCLFSSTYLEVDGVQLSTSGDHSICAWVKASSGATGTYQYLLNIEKTGARAIFYLSSSNDFAHWATGDSSPTTFGDSTVLRDGNWHHVAFTVSGGTSAKVYVDGHLNGSATITSVDVSAAGGTAEIGGTTSSSYLFDNGSGTLCHFGMWNAELTQAEVRELMLANSYASAVAFSGNTPAHYWVFESDLNASVGSINADASSGGATIVGARCQRLRGIDSTSNRSDAGLFSGRCLNFDGSGGSDDDFALGDSYSDSSDYFTLSLWVEQESTAAGRGILTNGPDAADVEHGLLYTTGSGGLRWYFQDGTAKQYVEADTSLQADTFHHVVITVDGSDSSSFDICMYLDGKLQDKTKATGGFSLADGLALGCEYHASNGANLFWLGSIADVKMLNVELTAAQVLELYLSPEKVLPDGVASSALKRWYPCSDFEITGAELLDDLYLQDASGNNKPLKISGCAMELSRPDIPQLAVRGSSSRCLFNDSDTVMRLSPSGTDIDCSGAFTYLFWFKTFSSNLDARLIDASGGSGPLVFIDSGSSSSYVRVRTKVSFGGSYHTWDTPNNIIPVGEWVHVGVTFAGGDTNEIVYFVNGASVAVTNPTGTPSGTQGADSGIKDIGGTNATQVWDGLISEVAIFAGTQLDADAVAAVYSGGQGFDLLTDSGNYDQSSNLDGWWRIDSSASVQDLKGSTDGAWNNAPTMVTVPENASGSSSFGDITTESVKPSKINFPFMQNVNSTQLQGYLEHKCPTWGTGEYCVAFWLRTTHLSGGATHYFWDIRGSTNSHGMRIYASGNNNILWKPKGAGSGEVAIYPAPASGTVTDGAWHFVALQRLGATSQKWHWRRITDASFNTGTNSTGFGDMTDAGTAYINGSSSATSPSGGQMALPRLYIGKSFSDNEIGNMFEQGKRILLGDTL